MKILVEFTMPFEMEFTVDEKFSKLTTDTFFVLNEENRTIAKELETILQKNLPPHAKIKQAFQLTKDGTKYIYGI